MQRPIAFAGGTVVEPDRLLENAFVETHAGKITRVGPSELFDASGWLADGGQIVDCAGAIVAPGFIDLHVHGGCGADFMDGTPGAVQTACDAHARHGTTTLFATTTTGSPAEIHACLEACRAYQKSPTSLNLAGVHLYGPYFAEGKVGCHSDQGRREPDPSEFEDYFKDDLVRIATCAAELPGAAEFYRAADQAGCLITCGHSNASWPELQTAFNLGMRHVDHFWCAMSSVVSLRTRFGTPMQASMAEFVLMNKEMSTEVIADGHHLSAELLEFAYRMLGPQRLCLVTDCNRALDMPAGEYRFGNLETGSMFESDGHVGWAPGRTSLASSIVGMDHMVRAMKNVTSASLPEVIRMATLTPAQRAGISDTTGSLAPDKSADIVVLDQHLNVKATYSGGTRL
ncbi:MAG TPA: N-acetylglucosamine-6-phosphate deacetylase [Planctomycetaceae bacterium]|nr:N-acetylglucosamine-6-phosphate deacetylase [Planctomycetaceae bacterium]